MRNPIESRWTPPVLASFLKVLLPPRRETGSFLLGTESVISTLGPTAQELFTDLLEDPRFEWAVTKLRNSLKHSLREEDKTQFHKRFVGFVGETISFNYLKETTKDNEILLSPWETDELYAYLYPGRLVPYDFRNGIRGVTVPDGLLFTRVGKMMLIAAAFEYSLTQEFDSRKRKQKQARHYSHPDYIISNLIGFNNSVRRTYLAKWFQGRYPNIPLQVFADLNFRFVSVFPRSDSSANGNEGENLPVSRAEFREVLNGIFEDVESSLERKEKEN